MKKTLLLGLCFGSLAFCPNVEDIDDDQEQEPVAQASHGSVLRLQLPVPAGVTPAHHAYLEHLAAHPHDNIDYLKVLNMQQGEAYYWDCCEKEGGWNAINSELEQQFRRLMAAYRTDHQADELSLAEDGSPEALRRKIVQLLNNSKELQDNTKFAEYLAWKNLDRTPLQIGVIEFLQQEGFQAGVEHGTMQSTLGFYVIAGSWLLGYGAFKLGQFCRKKLSGDTKCTCKCCKKRAQEEEAQAVANTLAD